MRLHLIKNSYSDSLDRYMPGIVMKGKLEATFKVRDPMGLVVKEDVDKALTQFPPEWITKPFLPTAFPAFKGDFVKNDKGGYDLKFIHKNETTFKIPEVDYAGRLTKESGRGLNADDFDGFPFERIRDDSFPKKPEELGILNNIPLDGSSSTNKHVHTTRPPLTNLSSRMNDLTTVIDVKRLSELQEPYSVGDIILVHKDANISNEGFLRLNGGLLRKSEYSELYTIIGDYYGMDFGYYGAGRPWQILDRIETSNPIPKFNSENTSKNVWSYASPRVPLKRPLGGYGIAVTDGLIHLIGGHLADRSQPYKEVMTGKLGDDGNVVSWASTVTLNRSRIFSKAIAVNNRLYLIGGIEKVTNDIRGVRPLVFDIDGVGLLQNEREVGHPLPEQMCLAGVHVEKRTIYVYGGHSCTHSEIHRPISSCYRATILPDGNLSEWIKEDIPLEISDITFETDAYRINDYIGYAVSKVKNINVVGTDYVNTEFVSRGYDGVNNRYLSMDTQRTSPITRRISNYTMRLLSARKGVVAVYDTYDRGTSTQCSVMEIGDYNLPKRITSEVKPPAGNYGNDSLKEEHGRAVFDIVATKNNLIVGPGLTAFNDIKMFTGELYVLNTLNVKMDNFGRNSYKEYYDGSRYLDGIPEDKFALPEIPDQLLDGELYSFFIKAK